MRRILLLFALYGPVSAAPAWAEPGAAHIKVAGISPVLYWGIGTLIVMSLCFWLFSLWNWRLKKEIRHRKATEKALIDSVLQYQQLVQVIPHGIVEVDRYLQVTYCNPPFAKILGLEPDDVMGKALTELIASESSQTAIRQMLHSVNQSGEHLSLQLSMSDTHQQNHEVRFDFGFTDQTPSESQVIIVTDLTRQEQAEKALRKSEAIYRNTFEHIQAGIAHLAIDGTITRANTFMCQMLGYSVDELPGLGLSQITHPEDVQISQEKLHQLHEAGHGAYSLAKRYRRKDGASIWGLVSVSLMQQSDGDDYYIVVVQDIDDFKHQQDEVAEASQNLESTVAQRTAELRRRVTEVEDLNRAMLNLAEDLRISNQQLEVKSGEVKEINRELESFAYSVSHDLRAPLRHISGFVSVLSDKSSEQLDDNARRYLGKISDSAEKMGKMIDDLLSFSRVGRTEMMNVPIDMHQLVMEVRRDIDENYPQLSIDWRVGSLPKVKGDVTALRQVVVNLLDNAAKYSSREESPRIEVMAEHLDGEVVFSIRDNGVGFDPTYAEKLFKVFQRLHREDEFAGTGIGLASVRRIIQRHGGWVAGESEPGQGACFRFALPEDSGALS